MKRFKSAWAWLAITLLPSVVYAANTTIVPNKIPGLPGDRNTGFGDYVIGELIPVLLAITGIIAVLFLIIGGYQYIVSGLNEEMAEQGKKTVQNAIIGLVVIILSYVIVSVIANSLID